MGRFCTFRRLAITLVAIVLVFGLACSDPATVPGESSVAQPDPHRVAYSQDGIKSDPPPEADNPMQAAAATAADNHLPFHDRDNLPAGTLISVRLKNPITAGSPQGDDSFEAIVVEPVVGKDHALIPRGTLVAGRVESARTSKLKPNHGYVRLSLESVHLDGVDVPVQTASLFARKSSSNEPDNSAVRVEKGRQLTFRLAEGAYISSQHAEAAH